MRYEVLDQLVHWTIYKKSIQRMSLLYWFLIV
jgi:hypothetical protein